MKRIYIAGPMSGLPKLNYPAFNAKAIELRAQGFHVENPAENPEPHCRSWLGYMRMALVQIARCDAVVMLPGWAKSRGARIEHQLAAGLGLEIIISKPVPEAFDGCGNVGTECS
ncbi:MAG TPA: DUF4406 domain-containing protein [Acidovorax sp.]